MVVAREGLPRADPRFRGYGLNKIAHLAALAAAGYAFAVLPDAAVVAADHAKSASWAVTFGAARDPRLAPRIQALYNTFKRELGTTPAAAARTAGGGRPPAGACGAGERAEELAAGAGVRGVVGRGAAVCVW